MKILITLLLLTLTVSYAITEEIKPVPNLKEYDVEIIIFEDAHARYLSSQTWGQTTNETTENQPDENMTVVDQTTKTKLAEFISITPTILNEKYRRISASSEYETLFYGAWRQAGLDKNQAFEINITNLKNTHTGKSVNALKGKFKLVLARYLHIYTELKYQRKSITPISENTLEGVEINDVIPPFKSHRRMRSKELHYIDHPLVGILIQINPVEKKKEEKL